MKVNSKKKAVAKPKIDYKQFINPPIKEYYASPQRDLFKYAYHFIANLHYYAERLLICEQHDNYDIAMVQQYDSKGNAKEKPDDAVMWVYNLRSKSYLKINLRWTGMSKMDYKTILIRNDIFIIGGCTISDESNEDDLPASNLMDKLNLISNTFTSLANVPTGKLYYGWCDDMHSCFYLLCGGYNSLKLSSCEKYEIKTNKWIKLPNSNEPKIDVGGVLVANSIYMFGGFTNKGLSSMIEKLQLTSLKWEIIKIKGTQLSGIKNCFPVYMGKNKLLIFGLQEKEKKILFEMNVAEQRITMLTNCITDNVNACSLYNNHALYNNNKIISFVSQEGRLLRKIEVQEINSKWIHNEISVVAPESEKTNIKFEYEYILSNFIHF